MTVLMSLNTAFLPTSISPGHFSSNTKCSWFPAPGSLFMVPCSMFHVPCSMFHVLCSWFHVPGFMFLVPYSWFHVSWFYRWLLAGPLCTGQFQNRPSPPPRENPRAFDFFEKLWSNSPLCCQFRWSNAPPVRASKRVCRNGKRDNCVTRNVTS